METHNEHDVLTAILAEENGIAIGHLDRLYGDADNRLYRVVDTTDAIWDMYVSRADGLADAVYTTWLSGYGGSSSTDFQLSRAGLLEHLEAEQYPTQSLRRTQAKDVLGYRDGWSVILTSSMPSVIGESGLTTLRGLGAALAHLHTLWFMAYVINPAIDRFYLA